MKYLCTASTMEEVTLFGDAKKIDVGKYYVLEPLVDKGTSRQNRTLHPLLDCLYSWMLERDTFQFEDNGIIYDLRCSSKGKLKTLFKIRYGKGACLWKYSDSKHKLVEINDLKELPDYVLEDFQKGNKGRINASEAISWKDYNKKDRIKLIDAIINIMKTIGVNSKSFLDILEGIKE